MNYQFDSDSFYELESKSYIGENGDSVIEYFIKHPFTTETWDWRELIYQMALDYRKHNHDDDFLLNLADANPNHYPTGKTGYEPYYIDLEAFWRELYNPSPEEQYIPITATDAGDLEDSNLKGLFK